MRALILHIILVGMCLSQMWAQDAELRSNSTSVFWLNPAYHLSSTTYEVGSVYRQSLTLADGQNVTKVYQAYGLWSATTSKSDNRWTLGVLAQSNTPSRSVVTQNEILAKLAYTQTLYDDGYTSHRLSVGVLSGLLHRRPRAQQYWYGGQYDIEDQRVDFGLPTGEAGPVNIVSRLGWELSGGVHWQSVVQRKLGFRVGASAYHLSPMNVSVVESGYVQLPRRYMIYAGLDATIARSVTYSGTAIFQTQGLFDQIYFRHWLSFAHEGDRFSIGISPNLIDDLNGWGMGSISLMTAVDWDRWHMEVAYDHATRGLGAYSDGRGNVEITVGYRLGETLLPRNRKGIL